MTGSVIRQVQTLALTVTHFDWPYARDHRSAIDEHFASCQTRLPQLFNGRILLARNASFADDKLTAQYFEIDFASFLHWRDHGFPDKDVFNGFGMGALRASDGAFLLGEMGSHTANAGKVYFASGTADLSDVRNGKVDIAGSIWREVEEETGLVPDEYVTQRGFTCVRHRGALAMIRILDVPMNARELQARLERNIAGQREPEFSKIHVVHSMADVTDAMPVFVRDFLSLHLTRA